MENTANRKPRLSPIALPAFLTPAGPFLLCVLLAAGVWCVNALNKTHVTTVEVPVIKTVTNGGAYPKNQLHMTIELSGRGFDLIRFLWYRKHVFTLVQVPGKHRQVSAADAALAYLGKDASALHINKVTPEWIEHPGDELFTRRVKVEPVTEFSTKTGFVISIPPVVQPESILVSSAEKIPAEIRSVKTFPLKKNNLIHSWFSSVYIDTTTLLHIVPERTNVWVYQKVEQSTECELNVPVNPGKGIPVNFRFIPASVIIRCSVPLSRYTLTTPDRFTAIAEINSVQQTKAVVRITRMPSWASNLRYSPISIDYLRQFE